MDDLISDLFGPAYEAIKELPASVQLVLVLVVIVVTQGPKLLAFRAKWLDYRLNRSQLLYEKERLEVLKLRYEIAALKKNNDLPAFAEESGAGEGAEMADRGIKLPHWPNPLLKLKSHIEGKGLWKWIAQHPGLGTAVLNVLYILVGTFAYLTAFATVSMILVSFSIEEFRTELDTSMLVYINLVYVLLTLVFFYWKAVIAHWRRALHAQAE